MTRADPIVDLPADVRRRLEAFTRNVERIDLDQLPMYAARPFDRDHRRTLSDAEQVATDHGRMAAVDAVRETAVAYVERIFVDAQFRPGHVGLGWFGSGTVDDRARIAESLGEAVTAVALWDVLDDGTRDELLGAWAGLAG